MDTLETDVWVQINKHDDTDDEDEKTDSKSSYNDETPATTKSCVISWGWLLTLSAFTLHFFTYGTLFSFGAMFVSLRDTFNSSETSVGWVGSIGQGVGGVLSPFASIMFEFFGFRFTALFGISLCTCSLVLSSFASSIPYMLITFGVMFGTGTSLVFNTCVNAVASYFQGRSAAASGLALFGMTVGTFTFNSLFGIIINHFGWRHMLRMLAGALAIICFPSCMAFKEPTHAILAHTKELEANEGSNRPRPNKGRGNIWKYVEICLTVEMLLLFPAVTIYSVACAFHYINLVSFMSSIGINESSGCLVVTILGAADGVGRLISSAVGDRLPCSRLYTLFGGCIVGAIPTFCLVFIDTFEWMVVYAIILGISRGVLFTMQYPVALETFGIGRSVEAITNVVLAMGLGTLLGSSVGGVSYDRTGSYETSFYICGGQLTFAATLILVLIIYRKRMGIHVESTHGHINSMINISPILGQHIRYTYVSVV